MITLEEAKQYLRVDFPDDDDLISGFISTAQTLCMDVARIIDEDAFASGFTPEKIRTTPNEYNAESRPIWKPMHMQPMYCKHAFVTASGSECVDVGADIFARGLCLPSDNKMTAEEQDVVIEIVRSCFN